MVMYYWQNFASVLTYGGIILTTCATTAVVAMFCSVVFRKTSISLMTSYLVMLILFCVPLPLTFFVKTFVDPPAVAEDGRGRAMVEARAPGSIGNWIHRVGISSPFVAAFSVPLETDPLMMGSRNSGEPLFPPSWALVGGYFVWSACLIGVLSLSMVWLFNIRWRVSQ
jgi:hypothetical protein